MIGHSSPWRVPVGCARSLAHLQRSPPPPATVIGKRSVYKSGVFYERLIHDAWRSAWCLQRQLLLLQRVLSTMLLHLDRTRR